MKEYDVFLNKQPEGEIIIYMLPYYGNFSVQNGLLIDAEVYAKITKKLHINDRIGLQAVVLSSNKHAFERVQNGIVITASTNFLAKKYVEDIETNIISIKVPDIDVVPTKVLYGADNSIGILESLSELKLCSEKFSSQLNIVQADISEMIKSSFEQCDGQIMLMPAIDDLLYRDSHLKGASAIGLTAFASIMLKRYRLLYEMDDNAHEEFDDITLDELDYVLLTD